MPYSYRPDGSGSANLGEVPNGAWQRLTDQAAVGVDQVNLVTFDATDFERFLRLESGNQIRVLLTGLYNIQYALQFYNSGGGGSTAHAHIWFKVNGSNVADSAVRQSVTSNAPYAVASRDYLLTLNTNDYLQLAWEVNHANIGLFHEDATGNIPIVASAVLTMTQVG